MNIIIFIGRGHQDVHALRDPGHAAEIDAAGQIPEIVVKFKKKK